ncbi:hypothetical protein [Campylobacter estrildidarum]|uniref:Uncharacterized protein n=1 Tax=Campylobacter estrildidarum TaxID=2510189 RepID=A0A4U7BE29_9BACT|nr:hypothetical protein [Campylobacter estrildidarum]TKX28231.1 hypothetical protein CQA69_08405 [Campylobacter estrildidarum]
MIPSFKASYEVANYTSQIEYLSEGGLYSGVFRKAFLYDKLASDGSINTFAYFEFLTKKEQKLATFNLFVAKNNSFSYVNKNGESEDYIGFRQLNAIMKFLEIDELDFSEKGTENVFGIEAEVIYLNSLIDKLLVLGFGTEEYLNKNGELANKVFLDRIFNKKMQNIDEFQNNKEPLAIKSFKARHKKIQAQEQGGFQAKNTLDSQAQNFTPKENQSYDPYANKNEKYIELEDNNKDLPF